MDLRNVPLSFLHLDLLTIAQLMGIRGERGESRPLTGAAPATPSTLGDIVRKRAVA